MPTVRIAVEAAPNTAEVQVFGFGRHLMDPLDQAAIKSLG
jgi:hypothetical protein